MIWSTKATHHATVCLTKNCAMQRRMQARDAYKAAASQPRTVNPNDSVMDEALRTPTTRSLSA